MRLRVEGKKRSNGMIYLHKLFPSHPREQLCQLKCVIPIIWAKPIVLCHVKIKNIHQRNIKWTEAETDHIFPSSLPLYQH